MALNVEPLTLENEYFNTMEGEYKCERMMFNGTYAMKCLLNPHPNLKEIVDDFYHNRPSHFHCKRIYVLGNILYKTNEPEIDSMIDLMIKSTYIKELPSFVDTTVKNKVVMVGGTVCPTKEVAFRYQGKLFILYGRYIYGYNTRYVQFVNEKPTIVDSSDDVSNHDNDNIDNYGDNDSDDDNYGDDKYDICYDEEGEKKPKITRDEIILPHISILCKDTPYVNDYNYCFSIIDEATEELQAFAIYR